MLLTGLEPDHISWADLLDRAALALGPTAPCRDDEDLAKGMSVPRGARARLERDRPFAGGL